MTTDTPALPAYSDDLLAGLSAGELVELLIRDEDRVPRNLIDRCAAAGDTMVDSLNEAMENGRTWQTESAPGAWWLMLHAAMILGLMPSEAAGESLVRLMRRIADAQDDNLQDWLAGDWPALFRNKPDSTVAAVRALAEDRALDWYIRCQAADAVIDHAMQRTGDALERELDWLARQAAEETEDWDYRLSAGMTLLDFPRDRHRVLLADLAAREAKLADARAIPGVPFNQDDIDAAFNNGADKPDWEHRGEPWRFYARGAILARQDHWAEEAERGDLDFDEDYLDEPLHIPLVRDTAKVGRNDPCPCGSGKKYKKCCLPKEPG
jgi:hypothetical protein